MKKIIICGTIAMLSILTATTYAQKNNSFIGISGGLSSPMGNWHKTDYSNPASGYAGSGTVWGLDGAYFFSKHIGVGGLANYSTYKNAGLSNISNGYIDSYGYSKVQNKASRYKMASFLGGLYYAFPAGKLTITARTLAGVTVAKTPEMVLSTYGDDDTYDGDITQHSKSKTAFAMDGGIGVSYPVYKRLAVALRADYFYTKPDFSPIENSGINNPQDDARVLTKYNEALNGINVTLGVTWSLCK